MKHRLVPRLVTEKADLEEGLFGQVFLEVFEVLPHLAKRRFRPHWHIRSMHYGRSTDGLTIPGVLDVAYPLPDEAGNDVGLAYVRDRHCSVLGSDWSALGRLWSSYFAIPKRVMAAADEVGPLNNVLGVHYRGNDKNSATWDTNPVSHEDFLAIIGDFLERRPELKRVFVASDDGGFAGAVAVRFGVKVINLGDPGFHKDAAPQGDAEGRADRAVLDCVLLSRCTAVLQTSSALSAFAKILTPSLEIHRCAASKMFTDIPYFPVAYIPRYASNDPVVQAVVNRLTGDDWTGDPRAAPFVRPFAARLRPSGRRRRRVRRMIEVFTGSPLA